MKHIKIVKGSYQVVFSMRKMKKGKSTSTSVGVYDTIRDAIEIRDFVYTLKSKVKILIKYDVLKLVNEKRKGMGYYPIRNSQEQHGNI
jgi:hypothetical protein